ncbi:hypothetical protein AMECASPLE_032055 [Ameca splendens]|uniref:Uncharacterized protein n=1 Tax=Ameca splendens TaxID=208324 RepID=A0ABV0XVF1_9TELE
MITRNEKAEHREKGPEHQQGKWSLQGKQGSLLRFMLVLIGLDELQLQENTYQPHPAVREGEKKHIHTPTFTKLCRYDDVLHD